LRSATTKDASTAAALEALAAGDARRAEAVSRGRLQVAVALDHLRAGRKDEAISTLRKKRSPATSVRPRSIPTILRCGRASAPDYAQIGDMEKSAAAYGRPVALEPRPIAAWRIAVNL
jgi:hypothetical protein